MLATKWKRWCFMNLQVAATFLLFPPAVKGDHSKLTTKIYPTRQTTTNKIEQSNTKLYG